MRKYAQRPLNHLQITVWHLRWPWLKYICRRRWNEWELANHKINKSHNNLPIFHTISAFFRYEKNIGPNSKRQFILGENTHLMWEEITCDLYTLVQYTNICYLRVLIAVYIFIHNHRRQAKFAHAFVSVYFILPIKKMCIWYCVCMETDAAKEPPHDSLYWHTHGARILNLLSHAGTANLSRIDFLSTCVRLQSNQKRKKNDRQRTVCELKKTWKRECMPAIMVRLCVCVRLCVRAFVLALYVFLPYLTARKMKKEWEWGVCVCVYV